MKAKSSILVVALAAICLMAVSGFASASPTTSAVFNSYGGACYNLNYITGNPDGYYAQVTGSGGGQIICTLGSMAPSGSVIETKAYGSGYFYIYAQNYDTGVWQQLKVVQLSGSATVYQTVSVGFRFNTVAIAIIPPPTSVNAFVDYVKV